jgi:hypothetical protein
LASEARVAKGIKWLTGVSGAWLGASGKNDRLARYQLMILGERGQCGNVPLARNSDDFVLDWTDSFAFKNLKAGYTHRTGMGTRKDTTFIATSASIGQEIAMIDNFAELAASPDAPRRASYAASTLRTQEYLDALWQSQES